MTAAPTRILTVPEAAALLRISRAQYYALARKGVLPHFKISNTIRVRESDLNNWISEQVDAGSSNYAVEGVPERGK